MTDKETVFAPPPRDAGYRPQAQQMMVHGHLAEDGSILLGESEDGKHLVDLPFPVPRQSLCLLTASGGAVVAWHRTTDLIGHVAEDCVVQLFNGTLLRGHIYPGHVDNSWIIRRSDGQHLIDRAVEWAAPVQIDIRNPTWKTQLSEEPEK